MTFSALSFSHFDNFLTSFLPAQMYFPGCFHVWVLMSRTNSFSCHVSTFFNLFTVIKIYQVKTCIHALIELWKCPGFFSQWSFLQCIMSMRMHSFHLPQYVGFPARNPLVNWYKSIPLLRIAHFWVHTTWHFNWVFTPQSRGLSTLFSWSIAIVGLRNLTRSDSFRFVVLMRFCVRHYLICFHWW